METGASLSYLEKAPSPPLPGGIPILVEGKDGQYVPSGDYFHPDQVSKGPSVPQAEFDMLKHQYVCSIEHRKALESKNRDLTSRLNELENKAGSGTYQFDSFYQDDCVQFYTINHY